MAHQRAAALVAVLAAVGLSACGGGAPVHSEHISKATFKGKWPVTVDGGTLACHPTKGGSITFSPDGTTDIYAVNDTAMSFASQEGWKNFHDIWAGDHDGPGQSVDPTDFDNEAHRICGMNGTA